MKGIIGIITSIAAALILYILAKISAQSEIISFLSAAQLMAILGFMGLCWAYILSSRIKILEYWFGGMDKSYKIHHIVGGLSFIAIINHPMFLLINSLPYNTISTYLLPSSSLPYTLGVLALYLLLSLLYLTLFVDLPYRFWKKTHEWMGLVIILATFHSFLVPSALSDYLPLKYWLVGWGVTATAAYIYKRFLYYLLAPSYDYEIENIVKENDTAILYLKKAEGSKTWNSTPGQFGFFSLEKYDKRDEHPFSLLSQNGEKITIAFKVTGQFTLLLSNSRQGQKIKIRGPFGTFGESTRRAKEMVWVAGGIGITPFATMANELKVDKKVTMFYTSSYGGPKVIMDAFRKHSEIATNFRFIEYDSRKQGHLTAKKIMEVAGDSKEIKYLLCGPIVMMQSLTAQLTKMGVKRKNIIFEDFALK